MKRFILGLVCGIALTASTAVYASSAIQAYLFPVTYEVNGESKILDSEYTTLNYKGHAYVPVRFIAESLGAGARYVNRDKEILISSEPKNVDETTRKVWQIQYRLNIGDTEEDVKKLLGNPRSERTNDDHQQAQWGYSIAVAPGYSVNDQTLIDIGGLEQGRLGAQLTINWTDAGKIAKIELWYRVTKTAAIMTYYAYPDGSTGGALYE